MKFKPVFSLQLMLAVLLALTLLLTPFNTPFPVSAAGLIPSPISPADTIDDTTPTFKWTRVDTATNYEVRIYKSGSTNPTQILTANTANCGTTTCTKTIPVALALDAYMWKARAKVGGIWQAFSSYKNFTLSAPGFDSQFTSDANGWSKVTGSWAVYSGFYNTVGILGKNASVKYKNNYGTLNYTLRARRQSSVDYNNFANHLIIRGSTDPLSSVKNWNTGYIFGWANNQTFSVFKSVNGVLTCLSPNLDHPEYGCWNDAEGVHGIVPDGWNTIQVIALGSKLEFYINGTLWWVGTDSSLASGKVGLGMYRDTSEVSSKLSVDYATLDFNTGTSPTVRDVAPAAFGSSPADWAEVNLAPVK